MPKLFIIFHAVLGSLAKTIYHVITAADDGFAAVVELVAAADYMLLRNKARNGDEKARSGSNEVGDGDGGIGGGDLTACHYSNDCSPRSEIEKRPRYKPT